MIDIKFLKNDIGTEAESFEDRKNNRIVQLIILLLHELGQCKRAKFQSKSFLKLMPEKYILS